MWCAVVCVCVCVAGEARRGEVRWEEEMAGMDDIGHVERGLERNIILIGRGYSRYIKCARQKGGCGGLPL